MTDRYIEIKITKHTAGKGEKEWAKSFTDRIVIEGKYAYIRFGPFKDLSRKEVMELNDMLDFVFGIKMVSYKVTTKPF